VGSLGFRLHLVQGFGFRYRVSLLCMAPTEPGRDEGLWLGPYRNESLGLRAKEFVV
jgi:hypothetical protein